MSESIRSYEPSRSVFEVLKTMGITYPEHEESTSEVTYNDAPAIVDNPELVNLLDIEMPDNPLTVSHSTQKTNFSNVVQPPEKLGFIDEGDWSNKASCRLGVLPPTVDINAFTMEEGPAVKLAKQVCKGTIGRGSVPCPVQAECLKSGMDEKAGIYGGLNSLERTALKRKLKFKQ